MNKVYLVTEFSHGVFQNYIGCYANEVLALDAIQNEIIKGKYNGGGFSFRYLIDEFEPNLSEKGDYND